MSTGPRIPLDLAQRAAAHLVRIWEVQDHTVVGSIRREMPTVGDIEIVVVGEPTPGAPAATDLLGNPCGKPGPAVDELHDRIAATMDRDGWTAIKGLKPGFRYAQVEIRIRPRTEEGIRALGKAPVPVKVEIHRPEEGRRGWMECIRTGSAEFSQAMLTYWKRLNRIGPDQPGSVDGWLVDREGRRVPTPTEVDAFNACRLLWAPPALRTGWLAILPVDLVTDYTPKGQEQLAKAMRHLGISHISLVEPMFDRQQKGPPAP